jgi:hypothetical protein
MRRGDVDYFMLRYIAAERSVKDSITVDTSPEIEQIRNNLTGNREFKYGFHLALEDVFPLPPYYLLPIFSTN